MPTRTGSRRLLDIAVLGTRGIPANYGGFETFAEELSVRLVRRGHRVCVYGRRHFVNPRLALYRGVEIRVFPCVRTKYLETISHTALSAVRALFDSHDIVLICNSANACLCWLPALAGQKVVLNLDGIERMRRKWGPIGRSFYRLAEFLAIEVPSVAVSDAHTIQAYYEREYGVKTPFIAYGADTEPVKSRHALERLGILPDRFILYVSRLEPENNAHQVMEAYLKAGVLDPLVVVGDAPYSRRYIGELREIARQGNILMPGAIYGDGYRELLSHCRCYVHATEVGGTHPALIEAMGVGCLVVSNDTPENREVVADTGLLYGFNNVDRLAALLSKIWQDGSEYQHLRNRARERVRRHYDWEKVTDAYQDLFYEVLS